MSDPSEQPDAAESVSFEDLSSEQQQELMQALNSNAGPELFSTRRPQNFVSGLSSGLKSIGKGVGAGVGCLIGLPIAGAVNDGALGFCKGLAAGVLGAVALPVASTCVAGKYAHVACNVINPRSRVACVLPMLTFGLLYRIPDCTRSMQHPRRHRLQG